MQIMLYLGTLCRYVNAAPGNLCSVALAHREGFNAGTDRQIFRQIFGERGGPAHGEEATEADGAAVL